MTHIYVQWATLPSDGWKEYESAAGANRIAPKPLPPVGHTQGNILVSFNERPGWVHGCCVQGVVFDTFDHYAFRDMSNGGVQVTAWNDDEEDWADSRLAIQIDFNPVAIDPALGVPNTNQVRRHWSTQDWRDKWTGGGKRRFDFDWFEWADFRRPGGKMFHGIWMENVDHVEHMRLRAVHSWKEWKK